MTVQRRTFLYTIPAMLRGAAPVTGRLSEWRSAGMPADLEPAFRYLESGAWKSLAGGRHAIDGDRLFVNVTRGETHAPGTELEAHRKYLDIHFLASGAEVIGYAPAVGLRVSREYSPAEDVMFYAAPAAYRKIRLQPGGFAVFFAGQPHMPGCSDGARPTPMHKVVMKVLRPL